MILVKVYPNIRNLREDRDLTQKQLASHLNTSQKTYSRYETGEHNIPTEILIELADYYSVSIDFLLGRTTQKDPYPKKK
ncbi:MAG: helix-turn-helix transcriptional regulator [Hespellia sp.]|nr:helix-turn-helix transcriptional regulator [Hespellia sp.]